MKHYKKNVINPYNNQNETKIVNAYAEKQMSQMCQDIKILKQQRIIIFQAQMKQEKM